MRRIVCVGNRYLAEDAVGPAVYERLLLEGLPDGVEAVDGGLGGLSLLGLVEGSERVVFVDRTTGFGREGEVVVLTAAEAAETAGDAFGHEAGLAYLLRWLPHVAEGRVPPISIVGVEGPPTDDSVAEAARVSRELVGR